METIIYCDNCDWELKPYFKDFEEEWDLYCPNCDIWEQEQRSW